MNHSGDRAATCVYINAATELYELYICPQI
jgi:hypothetical protein